MNPKLKWSLIAFAAIVLLAPTLGAQLAQMGIEGIQGAIASLKIFGEAVVPK